MEHSRDLVKIEHDDYWEDRVPVERFGYRWCALSHRSWLIFLGKIQHHNGRRVKLITGLQAQGFNLQNIVWALQKLHLLENTSLFNLEVQIQVSGTNACCIDLLVTAELTIL